MIDTVSGLYRLTATSLSPHPAATVAPLPTGTWAGTATPVASALATPSSLSAVAATSARERRAPSGATTCRLDSMNGWSRQVTV